MHSRHGFAPLNVIQRVSTNFGYFEGRFSSSKTCLGGLIFKGLSGFLKGLVVEIMPLLGLSLGEKGHHRNALFRIR